MDALYQLSYRGSILTGISRIFYCDTTLDEKNVVQGEGFEPPKAEPDDLQSPVFDRFTIPAN